MNKKLLIVALLTALTLNVSAQDFTRALTRLPVFSIPFRHPKTASLKQRKGSGGLPVLDSEGEQNVRLSTCQPLPSGESEPLCPAGNHDRVIRQS